MKFICRFCNDERINVNSLRNHERLCKLNPNKQTAKIEQAREVANAKITCNFCNKQYSKANIKKHISACIKNPEVLEYKKKLCPVCKKAFYTESTTCSHGCANTYFRSGVDSPTFNFQSKNSYVTICFSFHKKECIICGEDKIVAVHHFDEDHSNNSPENLIPLCPTHHQYFHSKYRSLVDKQINNYRDSFIKNIPPRLRIISSTYVDSGAEKSDSFGKPNSALTKKSWFLSG